MAFEEVADRFPPSRYELFVALSYAELNEVRKEKYLAAKGLGYNIPSYISSHATLLNEGVLERIASFLRTIQFNPSSLLATICCALERDHIGHHSIIHDHCFLASQIVVSGGVTIEESCFIGVNVTLRDHITIGRKCLLGAGTVLLKMQHRKGFIGLLVANVMIFQAPNGRRFSSV